MKIRPLGAALLAAALFLPAQDATILPYPYPNARFEELKSYLTLSDTQVTALQQVNQSKQDAENVVYRSIREKYEALNNALNSANADALLVGRLTLEIRDLQKKVPIGGEPYRTNALNVLNATQKAKLPALTQALQMGTTAYQAVSLNLIDQPQRVGVSPFDLPALVGPPAPASLPPQE
ncbi:MAG: hypothetical protein JNK48_03210 [Bryobacterales bacterium]|nr:hypothetical protein [Bryobacterales bacterium]